MTNKLILLIEDNTDDERLTLRALRKNNIVNEIIVAYDGEEALSYLFGSDGKPAGELPSVIILDLQLPKVTGLEVLQQIRSSDRTKNIPVIVLTSADDDSQVNECYASGANSFVKKPSDASEFSETILQLGMYWLLLNETPRAQPVAG